MIKVTTATGSYKLPTKWEEISFDSLQKIRSINLDQMGDSNILYMAELISTLMGCPRKEILSLSPEDFTKLSDRTKWVNSFDVTPTINFDFEFEGKQYGLVKDLAKLTIGEMASIEMFMMQGAEENADKIIAVIVREKDEQGNLTEFDADTLEARAKVLRMNMNIADVTGITNFFLAGEQTSTKTSADSSIQIEEM